MAIQIAIQTWDYLQNFLKPVIKCLEQEGQLSVNLLITLICQLSANWNVDAN